MVNIGLKYIFILFSSTQGFYEIYEEKKKKYIYIYIYIISQNLGILKYFIRETILKFFIGLLAHS